MPTEPYRVAQGALGVHEIALPANTEVVVEFEFSVRTVEVENVAGTGRVYFTIDGSQPQVKGANSRALPAAPCAAQLTRDSSATASRIRLIADRDTTASVTRL
jgi:hypothetical protein